MITPGTYWKHKREDYTVVIEQIDGLFTKAAAEANWREAVNAQVD